MTVIAPSKKFLYRKLKDFLERSKKKALGIDLASENFKNSDFFKTKTYIGVDIERNLINKGLKKKNKIRKIGIFADLTKKNTIGENFADVAVSTNTIYQIKNSYKRLTAIKNFIEFVKPDGDLFLQMDKNHLSQKILNQITLNFSYYKIIHYHNFLSNFYINLFDGKIVNNKKAILLDKIKFGYLLFLFEYILNKFSFLNKKVIIVCYKKNKSFKKEYLNKKKLIYA